MIDATFLRQHLLSMLSMVGKTLPAMDYCLKIFFSKSSGALSKFVKGMNISASTTFTIPWVQVVMSWQIVHL